MAEMSRSKDPNDLVLVLQPLDNIAVKSNANPRFSINLLIVIPVTGTTSETNHPWNPTEREFVFLLIGTDLHHGEVSVLVVPTIDLTPINIIVDHLAT